MRRAGVFRFGLLLLAVSGGAACWNRIEVHPAPTAAEADSGARTRVLGWSEEAAAPPEAEPDSGVVAHVEDGERTFHVVVGEDASGRSWSAAFSLDD